MGEKAARGRDPPLVRYWTTNQNTGQPSIKSLTAWGLPNDPVSFAMSAVLDPNRSRFYPVGTVLHGIGIAFVADPPITGQSDLITIYFTRLRLASSLLFGNSMVRP